MLKLLSVEEAAEALGISERRVRQLLEAGRIKDGQKVSGVWVVPAGSDGMPVVLEGRRRGRPSTSELYAGLAGQLSQASAASFNEARRAIEEVALNSREVRAAQEALERLSEEYGRETNRAFAEALRQIESRSELAKILEELRSEED